MKVLYFDCFSGISGDMTVGALLDLGVDEELFRSELGKLNLPGYEINIGKKVKNAITGTDFQVVLAGEREKPQEGPEGCGHPYGQKHVHEHMRDDCDHEYGHGHKHGHDHSHGHMHRNLASIEFLIDSSGLKQSVKDISKKIFREIGRAEAKVHNKNISEIHFHEVGAVDSIVDIVGAAICIDLLGVMRVFSSPLHDGCGYINTQHGILPVPVPAVMEMLANSKIPLVSENINTELITPTGMGIIKCIASDFGSMPAMMIDKIGYGFGKRETGRLNALRVVMGTLLGEDSMMEEIALLETNIDDMSSEIMAFTSELLLQNGALEVFYTPIYMKKNRPAYMLTVLSAKGQEERLVDIILKETTTLGIRRSLTKRYCMDRKIVTVNTDYGEVRVKVASKGELAKFAPEYEDCSKIARRTGLPLRMIYDMVNERYLKGNDVQ